MSKQFTVPIILPADPAAPMEAATKQYVDAQAGGGPAASEVYIGTDDPIGTNPETELWFDTDAVPTMTATVPRVQSVTTLALGPWADGNPTRVTNIATLTLGGLVHVAGNIEIAIVNANASTLIYCQVIRERSAVPTHALAGGWTRYQSSVALSYIEAAINVYFTASLPGDQIYVQLQRFTAGPGTWQTVMTDIRLSGITVVEYGASA